MTRSKWLVNSNNQGQKGLGNIFLPMMKINEGNRNILGAMIESNIKSGNQKLIDKNKLEWGVSITDACIDISTTNKLLDQLYNSLSVRFRKRKRNDI